MRPRFPAILARLASVAGVTVASMFPAAAGAQSSSATGALFLLLPVGAETVGIGQAAVAGTFGSESVWSNPAGIARRASREGAIHHSETLGARGDVVTVVIPNKHLGAIALSFNLLDFGSQQVTDADGTPVGLVLPRNVLFAATYGAAIGRQFSIGANFKHLQYRVDCTGQCVNVSTFSAGSSAVDVGAQYEVPGDSTIRFGAAIRNMGTKLKVNAGEVADPLPTRIEIGASYGLSFISRYVSDVSVQVSGDGIATRSADQPSARFGADLTYENSVHLRGGYLINDADGATAAVGFGLETGRLTFDIARTFGGLSEDAGKTPAYVSLRFTF